MRTDELMAEAASLPVEERTRLADGLLHTLNPPEPDVDAAWAEAAGRRLAELREGRVRAVEGKNIFD